MLQEFHEKNRNLIVNVGGELVHRDKAGVSPFDSVVQGGDAVWEGLRLYDDPRLTNNPQWLALPDGTPIAEYSKDWEGTRTNKRPAHTGDTDPLPTQGETSYEDSGGMNEYRIVGVFVAPSHHVETLKPVSERRSAEKAAKNPVVFGPGSTTGRPKSGLVLPT